MDELLHAFTLQNFLVSEVGPYFEGYCGEHLSGSGTEIQQMSGSSTPSGRTQKRVYFPFSKYSLNFVAFMI